MKVEGGRDILALIIDKDTRHTERLGEGLREQGFRVVSSFVKEDTEQIIQQGSPDIILIDPKDLGFGVTWLRQLAKTPIIVLSKDTKDTSPQAKMAAYQEEADLYLSKVEKNKAISPDVLAAYARAILLRSKSADKKTLIPPFTLQYKGGLLIHVLNLEQCAAFRDGTPLYIPPVQERLLALLATGAGRVFPQRELLTKHRGVVDNNEITLLRMDISRLRARLKPDDVLIKTASGIGYYLLPPSEEVTRRENALFDKASLVITEFGRVRLDGNDVYLSDSERRILMILLLNRSTAVPADSLIGEETTSIESIKNQVPRLRKKLGSGSKFIRNIDGGYRFDW